ncbi:uncharacterized protein LOC132348030 isoform X2 [Balaenoptera ricei]|uniref:uncharacterized protein LOC132348030 isoform X2 n=1 Tax=Balaenoptera ricei TaxID=2746895 RepID=UPI0028BE73ED|nr:uncharacterized protein LOC132348030 isoform X2 [Balaenoptera ricei]
MDMEQETLFGPNHRSKATLRCPMTQCYRLQLVAGELASPRGSRFGGSCGMELVHRQSNPRGRPGRGAAHAVNRRAELLGLSSHPGSRGECAITTGGSPDWGVQEHVASPSCAEPSATGTATPPSSQNSPQSPQHYLCKLGTAVTLVVQTRSWRDREAAIPVQPWICQMKISPDTALTTSLKKQDPATQTGLTHSLQCQFLPTPDEQPSSKCGNSNNPRSESQNFLVCAAVKFEINLDFKRSKSELSSSLVMWLCDTEDKKRNFK